MVVLAVAQADALPVAVSVDIADALECGLPLADWLLALLLEGGREPVVHAVDDGVAQDERDAAALALALADFVPLGVADAVREARADVELAVDALTLGVVDGVLADVADEGADAVDERLNLPEAVTQVLPVPVLLAAADVDAAPLIVAEPDENIDLVA